MGSVGDLWGLGGHYRAWGGVQASLARGRCTRAVLHKDWFWGDLWGLRRYVLCLGGSYGVWKDLQGQEGLMGSGREGLTGS